MKLKLLIASLAFIALPALGDMTLPDVSGSGYAVPDFIPDNSCPDQSSKVLSNICVDCFFPMRLGVQIGGGGSGDVPSDAYYPICGCIAPPPFFYMIGMTAGGWLPEGIFEVTPREYCSSTLGGTIAGTDFENRGVGKWADDLTYYNAHYIPFPVSSVASLMTGYSCGVSGGGGTSVGLWSELDPTWNDPELAALKTPEGVPSGSLMATLTAGCAAEYVAMQANSNYFGSRWCTGGSGQTYPLTGYATNSGNPATISALQSSRLLDEMYRLGMQRKTWGSSDQVCYNDGAYQTATPKNGHRMQQVAPQGETRNHRIGDDWNAGSMAGMPIPSMPGLRNQGHEINNNNYIFIDWKYHECCTF